MLVLSVLPQQQSRQGFEIGVAVVGLLVFSLASRRKVGPVPHRLQGQAPLWVLRGSP